MSEDQADEVDDGSGAWVEEDEPNMAGPSRRNGVGFPPYSPGSSNFHLSAAPHGRFDRGMSVESDARSVASSFREDESAWATEEMRDSMERARRLYRQQRGL